MTQPNANYNARLQESRRTLASSRKWHAMPELLDQLDLARRGEHACPEAEREVWIGRLLATRPCKSARKCPSQ